MKKWTSLDLSPLKEIPHFSLWTNNKLRVDSCWGGSGLYQMGRLEVKHWKHGNKKWASDQLFSFKILFLFSISMLVSIYYIWFYSDFYIRSWDHRNSPLEPGLCNFMLRFYYANNVLSVWLLSFTVRAKYRLYGKIINTVICMSGWKEVGSVTNVAKMSSCVIVVITAYTTINWWNVSTYFDCIVHCHMV